MTMTNQAPKREPHRFLPGNPGGPGRPKKVLTAQELLDKQIRRDIKQAAKDHSPEAFRFMLSVMRNEDASLQYRMDAAKTIIDRGWGKAANQTEISVSVYDKMSEVELIKLITGEELDESVIDVEADVVQEEPSSESEE